MHAIATVAITGFGAVLGTAAVDVFPVLPHGFDKLGIAGVAIWVMYRQLLVTRDEKEQEKKERQEYSARVEQLHGEIRREQVIVISQHARALEENARAVAENAKAAQHLAEVLDRMRHE